MAPFSQFTPNTNSMSVARFLNSLLAGVSVRVPASVNQNGVLLVPSAEELDEAKQILTSFEAEYRNELPGNPPVLNETALLWGALTVFRAASFLANRDVTAEVIASAFGQRCSEPASPSVCYSVDLTLRFLPDLIRLARAASENDPLVEILTTLGRDWPLSSVGVANVGSVDITPFVDHDCLRQLYVDRIIVMKYRSRMNDAKVCEAIRTAIGLHPELAPEVAKELNSACVD
jgi:hypothetical protein